MSSKTSAAALLCALASLAVIQAGCSSSSDAGSSSALVGTWACSYSDTFTASDGSVAYSGWNNLISITLGPTGKITITPLVDSGVPCAYTATTTSDTTATLDGTQSCDPGSHAGTLVVAGNSLSYTESFRDISGRSDTDGTCTRR